MNAKQPHAFDPLDPHGFGDLGEHHGHHITSLRTLVTVLIALLIFTFLTAGAAEFETYLITDMGWNLPLWVNISVAMSIAVVKALLVLLFFMGLKFENPLYAIVFVVSIFVFSIFLALTGLDLQHRGEIYTWKQRALEVGGTGVAIKRKPTEIHVEGEEVPIDVETFHGPLADNVREDYLKVTGISESTFESEFARENNHPAHHGEALSNADVSRPRHGLSDALDLDGPSASDQHSQSDSTEQHE